MHLLPKKLIDKAPQLASCYAALISIFWITAQSSRQLAANRLTTDFISWALTSMAPIFGIGRPYADYWGINPPGVLLMTGGWGFLIGSSLRSFHILYVLCLAMIVWLVWKVLGRVFVLLEQVVLFTLFCIFFFHSSVQSQFFPSEINGLLCATAGLWLILKPKPTQKNIFWAHVLFILAGQMKEVFALQGLSLLPHLLIAWNQGWVQTRRYLVAGIGGVGAAAVILIGYLWVNGALPEYRAINAYKSAAFSIMDVEKIGSRVYRSIQFPRDRFFYARYQVPIVLFVSAVAAMVALSSRIQGTQVGVRKRNQQVKLSLLISKKAIVYAVIACYWFGALLGYAMQGRYGNKYDIEPLLSVLIILALAARVITLMLWQLTKRPTTQLVGAGITLVSLMGTGILTMPQKAFLVEPITVMRDYSLRDHLWNWRRAEAPDVLALEQKIADRTTKRDCITSVYGWGIGDVYYYSQRPSCSKYFLVNILPADAYGEYAQALVDRPPKAIVYTHAGADLNTERFETEVFDFPTVLASCYRQDDTYQTLYWLEKPDNEASACISQGVPVPHSN